MLRDDRSFKDSIKRATRFGQNAFCLILHNPLEALNPQTLSPKCLNPKPFCQLWRHSSACLASRDCRSWGCRNWGCYYYYYVKGSRLKGIRAERFRAARFELGASGFRGLRDLDFTGSRALGIRLSGCTGVKETQKRIRKC